jgi:hypothetical protein
MLDASYFQAIKSKRLTSSNATRPALVLPILMSKKTREPRGDELLQFLRQIGGPRIVTYELSPWLWIQKRQES